MFGDDQDELFFDDNYPMISVYWGDILTHYPRVVDAPGHVRGHPHLGVGLRHRDHRLSGRDRSSGKHVVEQLAERDFDVAQSRYMKEEYGGTIGPGTWYLDFQRNTKPRRQGMAHAFSFPVCRWFGDKRPPMVPITINTCYPPNWISPRRAYALGPRGPRGDRGVGQRRARGHRHLGRLEPLHGRRGDRSPRARRA